MGVYETLSNISAYEILAATGAFCELAGFLWVITGVSQALSAEYEEHDLAHTIRVSGSNTYLITCSRNHPQESRSLRS